MIKAIFLGVDGVLNHQHFYINREMDNSTNYPYSEFDPISVNILNNIIYETDAKIILSSSWRFDDNIEEILKKVGLKFGIYGKTPYLCGKCRGYEIKEYLDKHPEIIDYIILDDDEDMLEEQYSHFFKCNAYSDGLNKEISTQVIKYLNNNF